MRFMNKWKEEWWEKRSQQLLDEYSSKENKLKYEAEVSLLKEIDSISNLRKSIEELRNDVESKLSKLKVRESEISEFEKRVEERKMELVKTNEELLKQIRILEAKASPSNVWAEAMTTGWRMAWDTMQPLLMEGVQKAKKSIEDMAIQETIKRNGNNKKNN